MDHQCARRRHAWVPGRNLRWSGLPLAAAVISCVGACVLKTPPDAAAIRQQAMPVVEVPDTWTAAGAAGGAVADNWLRTFGDDQLTAAVADAIAYNADLEVGAARVEQARLYAKLAGARLYPS